MTAPPPFDHDTVAGLLIDTEPFMSCDECFDVHDAAIEAFVERDTPLDERLRVHLRACPACLDEARSLAELLAVDDHRDPADVVAHLERALTPPIL